MNVFIANFGRENYEWPVCLEKNTIATMNEVGDQKLWEAGDKNGYIKNRMQVKTLSGNYPSRSTAAKWFNLMTRVSESVGDIWIHREKDQLWWTTSIAAPPSFTPKTEPVPPSRNVIVCHKPCEPWSNKNRKGNRLDWNALHPKAKDFLFTESTLQKLGEDNASYAEALINGDDLSHWHSLSVWVEKAAKSKSKNSGGIVFSSKQRAAFRMARTAGKTTANADGRELTSTVKVKNMLFSSEEALGVYIESLIADQEGLCAITGLRLQFDGDEDDSEMLCSLDRIDSDGHYERGNLQVVCRFINRWKNNDRDEEFRRLIDCLQFG